MMIISFVEGAPARKGGIGLVGVPMILASTAARGHHAALVMAGPLNPGREKFVVRDIESALKRSEGAGHFGIVALAALETWAFAPAILWRVYKYVRAADVVSLHSIYSFPVFVGYLLARFHRKPYGVWPHGVFAPFQRTVSPRKKWLYDRLIGRRILNKASVVFFSARGEREEAVSLGLKCPSVIVPHGIDVAEYASLPPKGRFRTRCFPGHEGEVVVFLARLNAKKGLDLLIRAMAFVMAQRPQVRLAIVGPPDPAGFLRQVQAWLCESGIESRTTLAGPVTGEAKLEVMADADVFALPSHAENFGFSVFEAMASGVPVVVTDSLNYAEEIVSSGAGIAVKRDPENLATAILHLLENPDLRRRMGASGRQLARQFDWQATGISVERTFESILQRRPLPKDLTD